MMCLDGCLWMEDLTIEGRKPVEGLYIPSGVFQKEPESGTETGQEMTVRRPDEKKVSTHW